MYLRVIELVRHDVELVRYRVMDYSQVRVRDVTVDQCDIAPYNIRAMYWYKTHWVGLWCHIFKTGNCLCIDSNEGKSAFELDDARSDATYTIDETRYYTLVNDVTVYKVPRSLVTLFKLDHPRITNLTRSMLYALKIPLLPEIMSNIVLLICELVRTLDYRKYCREMVIKWNK